MSELLDSQKKSSGNFRALLKKRIDSIDPHRTRTVEE
jgi:hypothetical protein